MGEIFLVASKHFADGFGTPTLSLDFLNHSKLKFINPSFMKRVLLQLFLCLLTATTVFGQVTSSAISGEVRSAEGEQLSSATIMVIHEPTQTSYGALTLEDGRFYIPNVRPGGPYTIRATYAGFTGIEESGYNVGLGNTLRVSFSLEPSELTLSEVEITSSRSDLFTPDRKGTGNNVGQEALNALPTISRSISDFTRLTPQSNGGSFGGRDERFNNYSIDGNIYNNNFGLGRGQFAGSNPVSLDAIEEVQVNLAPYDVRQGGFSGASVNAITRSGTNQLQASVYSYYRDERFLGTKIGEQDLSASSASTRIVGGRVGGALIKDRLFFFVSVEQETADNPGPQKVATRDGLAPDGLLVSRVPARRLDSVREQMLALYDYETGPYEGYNFANNALRLNARLDFNINQNHKLMVRFNRFQAFRDTEVNGNSLRYHPSALRYFNTNRTGIEAMNFRNSHYSIDNNVTSVVAELNSILTPKMSNNFRVGYTAINDPIRSVPGGQDFPFIEVMEFDGTTPLYYMTLGNELFTVGNLLSNQVFNITNNFNYFAGAHSFTAGVNFELQNFQNAFNPTVNGVYRYNSYDNFVASVIEGDESVRPDLFLQGYSFLGPGDLPTDNTRFAQLGVYVQDDWQATSNINVSLGLRVDMPFYPIDLPNNPKLDELNLEFTNPRNDATVVPDVSVLPSVNPLVQPRVGINWDVFGDRKTQVRAGSGLFSGRIPFVWISNQVNGNGVTRGGYGLTPDQWGVDGNPEWRGFQDDVTFYRPAPEDLEATVSNTYALTDTDFRLPMVWRSNLAVDQQLPGGFVATVEGIYSRDLNGPLAVNINTNEAPSQVNIGNGAVSYPRWPAGPADYYTNQDFRDLILLTNINEGFYASVTFQLQKTFGNAISASVAYTRSVARDYGLEGGSQAASLWPNQVQDEDRNDPQLGFSRFDQPHRVVGYLSVNTSAFNPKNTTTFSLFYDGRTPGRFSYAYSGNWGDGSQRMIFVPENQAQSNLVDIPGGATAGQQWTDLDNYIEQDPYLSTIRGQVAERNGGILPFLHRFDFRMLQDINLSNNDAHKLQLSLDILNIGNFINSEWGVLKTPFQRNLLNFTGTDAQGNAQFVLNTIPGTSEFATESFRPVFALSQTWSAQIGVRYLFN